MRAGEKGIVAALLLGVSAGVAAEQVCATSVRATTPDSRFEVRGDGTVVDGATGLMWQRCPQGMTPSGDACLGTAALHTWAAALTSAQDDTFAGHDDWRLPNVKELSSLVEQQCVEPSANLRVFPGTPPEPMWTASPSQLRGLVWTRDFRLGLAGIYDTTVPYPVRLVRDPP